MPKSGKPRKSENRAGSKPTAKINSAAGPDLSNKWWLIGALIIGAAIAVTALVYSLVGSDERPLASTSDASTSDKRPEQELSFESHEPSKPDTPLVTVASPIDVIEVENELRRLARELLRLFDKDATAWHVAAQIYMELDQTQEAEKAWRACLERKPTSPGPFVGLAELYLSRGEEMLASQVVDQAHAAGVRSAKLSLSAASIHERQGELVAAKGVLAEALQSNSLANDGPLSDLWFAMARTQNQLGELAEAEESLEHALATDPNNQAILALLVSVLARQQKSLRVGQVREQLQAQRGEAARALDEPDRFQRQLAEATREFAYEMLYYADAIAQHHGQLDRSEVWLRRAQALVPDDVRCYQGLARLFRRQNRLEAALDIQHRLVALQPDDLSNSMNLASLAMQLGDSQTAEKALIRATELDPQGAMAQLALTRVYAARSDWKRAMQLAEQTAERHPNLESLTLLAMVYEASGNSVAAQAARAEVAKLQASSAAHQNQDR